MRVVLLPAAEHDLGSLFLYIKDELHNEIAAKNVAKKILRRAQSLASFPEMGADLENTDHRLGGYRYLLVDNYILVYKVTDEVCILRILFARSDYIQLLQG